MSDPKPNPYVAICPSRALLSVIGDKWSLLMFPLLFFKHLLLLHPVQQVQSAEVKTHCAHAAAGARFLSPHSFTTTGPLSSRNPTA